MGGKGIERLERNQRTWMYLFLASLVGMEFFAWVWGPPSWVYIVVAIGWLGIVIQDAAALVRREVVALNEREGGDGR